MPSNVSHICETQKSDSSDLSETPQVSVVIPSYNRCESMLSLLSDVGGQKGVAFEIIVVDDCSTDNSVEQIRSEFPRVRLFVNDKNGGPAVTRNRGIKEAKASIIVSFDSDVSVPDAQCLRKALDAFKEMPDAAGLAFHLYQPDGKTEDYARWWHPVPIEKYSEKRFKTDYFSGTGCAFRKASLEKAGLYPEILYMHYEEYELAYRILDTGKDLVYSPDIWVVHHEGQVSRRSEIKSFYKHRNQILVAVALFPLHRAIAYVLPRTIFTFLNSIRYGYTKSYFKSLKSAYNLSKVRIKNRKPLRSSTWKRIKTMKSGVLV